MKLLQIAQKVCVSREGCALRYRIRSGDTCDRIALAYKLKTAEILELNEDVACENLQAQPACLISISAD